MSSKQCFNSEVKIKLTFNLFVLNKDMVGSQKKTQFPASQQKEKSTRPEETRSNAQVAYFGNISESNTFKARY